MSHRDWCGWGKHESSSSRRADAAVASLKGARQTISEKHRSDRGYRHNSDTNAQPDKVDERRAQCDQQENESGVYATERIQPMIGGHAHSSLEQTMTDLECEIEDVLGCSPFAVDAVHLRADGNINCVLYDGHMIQISSEFQHDVAGVEAVCGLFETPDDFLNDPVYCTNGRVDMDKLRAIVEARNELVALPSSVHAQVDAMFERETRELEVKKAFLAYAARRARERDEWTAKTTVFISMRFLREQKQQIRAIRQVVSILTQSLSNTLDAHK